jgi:predicted AlkP superfamily phosphohydrolase/phosphomutase/tetratricopeptide (TPR) repeat protein
MPKVLLVGWDAADWKVIHPLLAAGKLPNLQRLVTHGATGSIATLHPPLSPMLWTSVATGKRPFKHGVHGFTEPAPDGRGICPITNLSRKAKALWNILSQNHLRSTVIGWWPSHPVEVIHGIMLSDHYHRARGPLDAGWPLPANTIHPSELADTLAAFRVHPDQLAPSIVEPFIPLAREIDQDEDKRLALFLRTLAECMSIQSAALWLLDHQPWDFFAVYFESVDHFCHGFMRYHPPRLPWIGAREFELYHNVVSMAYQFHDEMLGDLVQKAGGDTIVILMSDHGFHPDHLRPSSIPDIPSGPAVEHRDYGVFAIAGPGIKPNHTVYGPSLLDVAPTILNIFGLPVGEDMDGKVLSQLFEQPPNIRFIPSWESTPGTDGGHPPHTRLDPVAAHEAMEQMIALGYIERPNANCDLAIQATLRDLRYNLGESYQDDGRHAEAHAIFRELCAADPDEQRFAVRLFVSCQALGRRKEMRRIVRDLDGRRRALFEEARKHIGERDPSDPDLARWRNLARFEPAVVDYLKAQILIGQRRHSAALAALERLIETDPHQPALYLQAGDLCLRLRRLRDARRIFSRALAIDPDSVSARIALCRIALCRRQSSLAAHLALDALQRSYQNPVAHFLLGRALAARNEHQRAADAFRGAITFNPNFPEAHIALAALLHKHLGDPESALEHRRLAQEMRTPGLSFAASHGAATVRERCLSPASPLSDSIIVVTGLPRSGTFLLMQMLSAGGASVLSDDRRLPDEDNPRGYLEFEPVKSLLRDSQWLYSARGKAIKIVAPLLVALPPGLPCRVILCERDLDEVLDSQDRMLQRRNQPLPATPERRRLLKDEYVRTIHRVKDILAARPDTQTLIVDYAAAVTAPLPAAARINTFLDDSLDVAKMARTVDRTLHRNRRHAKDEPTTPKRP